MRAGHDRVDIPASRLKEAVLKVLAQEGYIGVLSQGRRRGATRCCASA